MRRVAAAFVLAAACGGASSNAQSSPTTHRPGAKETCSMPTLDASLGWHIVDRRLVPYSPSIQGVEETYERSQGQRLQLIAGGYFDDITEPYDGLEERGTTTVRGSTVTLLSGQHLSGGVDIALWRESDRPPCDAHAVVATELGGAGLDAVVRTLQ